jgi:signal transduction histidine kinase
VTIILGLMLIESLLLLVVAGSAKDLPSLVGDLNTIIIVFVFVVFVIAVVVYNFIPVRIKKSLGEVNKLINEISHGNYQVNIDPKAYEGDKDIQDLLHNLQKMLNVLQRFDQSKADKIFEHHQRLQLLINLLPQETIITLANGEIKYCNDAMRRRYPAITEEVNINEVLFKSDFDQKIFNKISNALRYGNILVNEKIPDIGYQRQAVINGSIVRNRKGLATGGVFIINYIENAQ